MWYATQERTSPTYGDDEDESRSSKSKEGQVISEIFELVVQVRHYYYGLKEVS